MIQLFNYGKTKEKSLLFLVELIKNYNNYDFYLTENNSRVYIDNVYSLKKFLKSSTSSFVLEGDYDFEGLLLIWRGLGGSVKRHYVKVVAKNKYIVDKLLTVSLWYFTNDLYIKISKDSEFLEVFKKKGFRFEGGRGRQILLKRNKVFGKKEVNKDKDEEED